MANAVENSYMFFAIETPATKQESRKLLNISLRKFVASIHVSICLSFQCSVLSRLKLLNNQLGRIALNR